MTDPVNNPAHYTKSDIALRIVYNALFLIIVVLYEILRMLYREKALRCFCKKQGKKRRIAGKMSGLLLKTS